MSESYSPDAPTRGDVDATAGPLLLEFGADWCPHCQAAHPVVEALSAEFPGVPHQRIADGPGRPLGRSFRVKLWPNFVFLKDGEVKAQMARPTADELRAGFESVA